MNSNLSSNASGDVPTVSVTAHTTASVAELLAMSEEFFRTAGPAVAAELRAYLTHRCPPADPSWFIDMLGFTTIHLGHLLRDQSPATAPPSENWQHDQHEHEEEHEDEEVCR